MPPDQALQALLAQLLEINTHLEQQNFAALSACLQSFRKQYPLMTLEQAYSKTCVLHNPTNPLYILLKLGDKPDYVSALMNYGANPNEGVVFNRSVYTPFAYAIQQGYDGTIKAILDNENFIFSANTVYALLMAASCKRSDVIKKILGYHDRLSGSIDELPRFISTTPLWAAVENDDPESVFALVSHGANPDRHNGVQGSTFTPLSYAKDRNKTQIIKAIDEGENNFLIFKFSHITDQAELNKLFSHTIQKEYIDSVYHFLNSGKLQAEVIAPYAIQIYLLAIAKKREDVVKIIMPHLRSQKGDSNTCHHPPSLFVLFGAIAVALHNKDLWVLNISLQLFRQGYSSMTLEAAYSQLQTKTAPPLDAAVEIENLDFAFTLINHGADPNACIKTSATDFYTPLSKAISQKNILMINALLDHEKFVYTDETYTALRQAAKDKMPDVVKKILSKRINSSPLLDRPASGNEMDTAPIWLAVKNDDPESVFALVSHGVNPHRAVSASGKRYFSPLSYAKEQNKVQIVNAINEGEESYQLFLAINRNNIQDIYNILNRGKFAEVNIRRHADNIRPHARQLYLLAKSNEQENITRIILQLPGVKEMLCAEKINNQTVLGKLIDDIVGDDFSNINALLPQPFDENTLLISGATNLNNLLLFACEKIATLNTINAILNLSGFEFTTETINSVKKAIKRESKEALDIAEAILAKNTHGVNVALDDTIIYGHSTVLEIAIHKNLPNLARIIPKQVDSETHMTNAEIENRLLSNGNFQTCLNIWPSRSNASVTVDVTKTASIIPMSTLGKH